MHADHPFRLWHCGRQPCQGNGRRVAGQNRCRPHDPGCVSQQAQLEFRPFGGCLDHPVAASQGLHGRHRLDAVQYGSRVKAAAGSQSGKTCLHAGPGTLQGGVVHIQQPHGQPGLGTHLGNAASHLAGSQHGDCRQFHGAPLLLIDTGTLIYVYVNVNFEIHAFITPP